MAKDPSWSAEAKDNHGFTDCGAILENAPMGIYTSTPEGRFLFVNPAMAGMFGYESPKEMLESVTDIASQVYADPGDRREFMQLMQEHGSVVEHECRLKRRDGTVFWVSRSARAVFDDQGKMLRYQGINTDITRRRAIEEELRRKTELLQNITDNMVDLVSVTDMEGNYKFTGPSHSILGYDPDSLAGRNVMEFVHPDDYQAVANIFAGFLANREDGRKVEYRYRRADGGYLWFETVGKFIFDDAGHPEEILFSTRDITARKQAEGKLKKIEWMLSREQVSDIQARTKTHDQGYGDLTELNREGIILKSIGHERLKSFADDYLELLGTSSAIYEANGDYAFGIFASGWCRMMDRASRDLCDTPDNVEALNSGRWLCHESCWTDCAKEAIAGRSQVDIECNGGIRMYAEPIFAGGDVIGAINFGYGDPPKDPEKLKILADTCRLDYDDLLREAAAYDSRPPYIIEMAKRRLSTTARLIGSMVETKQAMDALREREAFIKAILDNLPVGVAVNSVDPDVNFTYMNDNFARFYRTTREELTGPADFWEVVYQEPEFREKIKKRVLEDCAGGDPARMYWKGVPVFRPGRKPFYITAKNIPLPESSLMLSTVWDVTDLKLAEEALTHSYNLLRYIVEHMRSAVAVHDRDLNFIYVSQQYLREYKVKDKDIIGKHHYEVFPDLPQKWRDAHQKALAGEVLRAEEDPYFREDGSVEWTRWECRPWYEQDGSVGGIIIYTEVITERKQAQEEREKLQAQLFQAQKMESVGVLAGGIAHDFNNLLHVISGNLEFLGRDKPLDHPDQKRLQTIQKSINRASGLVQHLLLFSRKAGVRKQVLDLNHEIQEVAKLLERSIPRMINIELILDENAWPINADPVQVEQVLLNLGANAADAMPDGGRIIIETANMTPDQYFVRTHSGAKPGKYVLMTVSDTGCGMDKKTSEQIFDPFFTTKEMGKGTGLGLASVYGVVKAHEGYVYCYSEPGRGTTFRIYWPADPETGVKAQEINIESTAAGGSETILVVDDEDEIRELTGEALQDHGYNVLFAASGEQALEIYSGQGRSIDLVLLDLNMPGMGGRRCLKELLRIDPGAKVLIASGYWAHDQSGDIQESGAAGFMGKPFQAHELLSGIRKVLDS
jgi:PAS domain S-box-containing protein